MQAGLSRTTTVEPAPAMPAAGSLAGVLREWRRAHGMSEDALAHELGVGRTTARNWERGVRPQPLHMRRIAALLDVSADELRTISGPDRVRTIVTSGGSGGSALTAARLERGLTTSQVALKLGVSRGAVSRWENGVRQPSQAHRTALVALLRIDSSVSHRVLGGVRPPASRMLPCLAAARVRAGLSQRAMAQALAVSPGMVSKWESCLAPVPARRWADIAECTGVSIEMLLRRDCGHPLPRRRALPLARPRHAAGMTQREAAAYLGVAVTTLGRWERQVAPVAMAAARRMAQLYRCPLTLILRSSRSGSAGAREAGAPTVLAARLMRARAVAGRSQEDVAARLGVSRSTVSGWERGHRLPAARHVRLLELILELPPGHLRVA